MYWNRQAGKKLILFFLLSFSLLFVNRTSSSPSIQSEEKEAEKLLVQADSYYQKGEYKLAIGCYVEATALAQSKINLSRSYFGLALSYFFLRDTVNSTKWMRKVCEVDPKKEISELFYPRSFVQLFNQVQREAREKQTAAKGEEVEPPSQPVSQKIKEEPKATEEPKSKTEADKETRPKAQAPAKSGPSPEQIKLVRKEEKGGNFEVGVHYSFWSMNPLMGLFEKELNDRLSSALQTEIVKKLGTTHAGLVKSNFAPSLSIDSDGSNYGLEVRFFSRGRAGTFSLGLSFEKTHMKFSVTGQVKQEFTNGGYASVNAQAQVEARPFSTNISFRWDLFSASRISPYFVLGCGFAPLKGEFSYSYSGNYEWQGYQEKLEDAQTKNFDQLSEDIDFDIPKNIIVIQINLGIKALITKDIYLLAEAGIWDGFLLRAGMAYRF